MTVLKIVLIILGAIFLSLALFRVIRKLHRSPASTFIGRFLDSDFRRWFQPPDKMIERSGIKPGMTVMELGCGSGAYDLPFVEGSLDLVCMVNVLPEIPDRGKALREVRRVLTPGGILAITEFLPDPDYPLPSTTIKLC